LLSNVFLNNRSSKAERGSKKILPKQAELSHLLSYLEPSFLFLANVWMGEKYNFAILHTQPVLPGIHHPPPPSPFSPKTPKV
jgi:hypothetical protein